MQIFLVQHGQAMTTSEDPLRPLTPEGFESARRIGAWARDAAVNVTHIRHSGKLRAEQTAQILAEYLNPSGGLISASGLAPNDDVVPVARIATNEWANSMLVGHLPFLNRLAGLLVTGNPEIQVVRFCNAGIVCLLNEKKTWSINWVMTPELLV